MKTILIATEKPFAAAAVEQMKKIAEDKGYKVALLEGYTDKQDLINAVSTADAVIIRSDKATKEVLDAGKNLKIIVRAGAGFDNIDLEAATANNIVAMNTPGQNANAVAELAFGMMIFQARNKLTPKSGKELRGKKIGIHGFGNIGYYIGKIAQGMGMEIWLDPYTKDNKKARMDEVGAKKANSINELYQTCDYISINIPSNDKTKKSINWELLKNIKNDCTIINTARKDVFVEDDLLKTFEEKAKFNYLSDISPDNIDAILEKYSERCLFTPKKMGAQTNEANVNAGIAAVNQIINFFENGDETFRVNK